MNDDLGMPTRGQTTPISRRAALGRIGAAAATLAGALSLQSGNARVVGKNRRNSKNQKHEVDSEINQGSAVSQGYYSFATYIEVDLADGISSCSGSLVTPSHVLTAAHCVTDDNNIPYAPGQFTLTIGRTNLGRASKVNRRGVSQVFIHPAYDPVAVTSDIAVISLSSPVPSSVAIPVEMVSASDTSYERPGDAVIIAGWGDITPAGPSSDVLLEAFSSIESDATCKLKNFDPATEICAHSLFTSGCSGDSGGPILSPLWTAAASENVDRQSNPEAMIAESSSKKKRRRRKRNRTGKPQPNTDILIGIHSSSSVSCTLGSFGASVQLSAPSIRSFVTSVTGY